MLYFVLSTGHSFCFLFAFQWPYNVFRDRKRLQSHKAMKARVSFNHFMTDVLIIYKNQSIDLQSKSLDWVLYDIDLRHERVN